jgi:hypothetical protein
MALSQSPRPLVAPALIGAASAGAHHGRTEYPQSQGLCATPETPHAGPALHRIFPSLGRALGPTTRAHNQAPGGLPRDVQGPRTEHAPHHAE